MRLEDCENKDLPRVFEVIEELEKYYPNIKQWWNEKEAKKISNKIDSCILVKQGEEIIGVAISGPKGSYSAKLKTFYIKSEFQHKQAIGCRLLDSVIEHWKKKKINKLYVTFAEEEVLVLQEFFLRYGFLFDGISPFAYRKNVSEYIMSKIFDYNELSEDNFEEFVIDKLFRLRGYHIKKFKDYYVLEKIITLKEPYKIYVKVINQKEPSKEILKQIKKEAEENNCPSRFLATFYPLNFKIPKQLAIKVIDGYDIENCFYPLVLNRKRFAGAICTVDEKWGKLLFPRPKQTLLFPFKKLLRSDSVYFKSPSKQLMRGSTVVFYETFPTQKIIAEGRVQEICFDTPENLFEKFGEKGVIKLKELKAMANKENKLMALVIGKKVRYPNPIPLKKVKELKNNFNPQGITYINSLELRIMRREGRYFDG